MKHLQKNRYSENTDLNSGKNFCKNKKCNVNCDIDIDIDTGKKYQYFSHYHRDSAHTSVLHSLSLVLMPCLSTRTNSQVKFQKIL